ncbi:MAG: aminoglycoside N(3)-acetyltransferase [Candidatus Odinarchaeota archaeon]
MTEKETVERTKTPNTKKTLVNDFTTLGIRSGDVILLHASMSNMGWIAGGPTAVIEALMDVLTPEGTLVMPAHSGDNSEPSKWGNPPVPETWWQIIRDEMVPFDPRTTPTRGMGRIAEVFRTYPGVTRSNHPQSSFSAWGKHSDIIAGDHPLAPALGQTSPLGKVYDLNGKILLLGVTHESNTSLHLAEYLCSSKPPREVQGSAVMEKGVRTWKTWEDIVYGTGDFEQLGNEFEKSTDQFTGKVGLADARLISQRQIVDFAVKWFEENREKSG